MSQNEIRPKTPQVDLNFCSTIQAFSHLNNNNLRFKLIKEVTNWTSQESTNAKRPNPSNDTNSPF
jgi:hypothetical protein